jgi:hypothetical protein
MSPGAEVTGAGWAATDRDNPLAADAAEAAKVVERQLSPAAGAADAALLQLPAQAEHLN